MGPIANEEHTKMICKNIPVYSNLHQPYLEHLCF